MGLTDRERLDVYTKLESSLGAETADALMDYLLLSWRQYDAASDRVLAARALPAGSDLAVALAAMRSEVRASTAQLSAEIRAATRELRAELGAATSESDRERTSG